MRKASIVSWDKRVFIFITIQYEKRKSKTCVIYKAAWCERVYGDVLICSEANMFFIKLLGVKGSMMIYYYAMRQICYL